MVDIPMISELIIKYEKGTSVWDCYFKLKGNRYNFNLKIGLYNEVDQVWLPGNLTRIFGTQYIRLQDDDHIFYQCVSAIKKLPELRVKMMFSEAEMCYFDSDFTPAVYDDFDVKVELKEKKNG